MTNLDAPVSQSVETFLLLSLTWKLAVLLSFMWICTISSLRSLTSQISELSEEKSNHWCQCLWFYHLFLHQLHYLFCSWRLVWVLCLCFVVFGVICECTVFGFWDVWNFVLFGLFKYSLRCGLFLHICPFSCF